MLLAAGRRSASLGIRSAMGKAFDSPVERESTSGSKFEDLEH